MKRAWLLLAALAVSCTAVTPHETAAAQQASVAPDRALNTYFFTAIKPDISLAGAGRPGTTRVQVQLRESQVSSFMPVVTAAHDGLTHNVVNTWKFLQSYAQQSKLVSALNSKAADKSAHRFPVAAYSLQAASALQPTSTDTSTATLRRLLSQPPSNTGCGNAPTNVLLLPTGSAIGAVADIMSVEAVHTPGSEPAVVLTLDVVHQPDMTSELQPHPTQTLDDHAHYHFFTPPGVTVDADMFLSAVKSAAAGFSAIHVFAKGACPGSKPCTDDGQCSNPDDVNQCKVGVCPPGEGTRCCTTKLAEPGEVCRPAKGKCDVPEYCTAEGTCPPDGKANDGTACTKLFKVPIKKKHYSASMAHLQSTAASPAASTTGTDTKYKPWLGRDIRYDALTGMLDEGTERKKPRPTLDDGLDRKWRSRYGQGHDIRYEVLENLLDDLEDDHPVKEVRRRRKHATDDEDDPEHGYERHGRYHHPEDDDDDDMHGRGRYWYEKDIRYDALEGLMEEFEADGSPKKRERKVPPHRDEYEDREEYERRKHEREERDKHEREEYEKKLRYRTHDIRYEQMKNLMEEAKVDDDETSEKQHGKRDPIAAKVASKDGKKAKLASADGSGYGDTSGY